MKFKEYRYLDVYTARSLAIKENWFTKADNDIYTNWLNSLLKKDKTVKNLTANNFYKLAETVIKYSELPDFGDKKELIENIMFILCKESTVYFEIIDN